MKRKEEQIEKCEYIHVHEDAVKKVNEQMPEEDKLYDLADFLRYLRILQGLKCCMC